MEVKQIKAPEVVKNKLRKKFVVLGAVGCIGISSVLALGIVDANKTSKHFEEYYWATHKVIDIEHGYKSTTVTFSMPITVEKRVKEDVLYPTVAAKMTVIGNDVEKKELTLAEKKEVVKNSKYPFIISGIWMNETTQGKGRNDNDPTNHQSNCAKAGLSNEFGYDPQHNTCFKSFEDSVAYIDNYIDEHLKDLSVNQTLCVYNIGKAIDNCTYVQNFRMLDQSGKLALK